MAPWEGLGDFYRESIIRGGIPDYAFWALLFDMFAGTRKTPSNTVASANISIIR